MSIVAALLVAGILGFGFKAEAGSAEGTLRAKTNRICMDAVFYAGRVREFRRGGTQRCGERLPAHVPDKKPVLTDCRVFSASRFREDSPTGLSDEHPAAFQQLFAIDCDFAKANALMESSKSAERIRIVPDAINLFCPSAGPSAEPSSRGLVTGVGVALSPSIREEGSISLQMDQTTSWICGATYIQGVGSVPNTKSVHSYASLVVPAQKVVILTGLIQEAKPRLTRLRRIPIFGPICADALGDGGRIEVSILLQARVVPVSQGAISPALYMGGPS